MYFTLNKHQHFYIHDNNLCNYTCELIEASWALKMDQRVWVRPHASYWWLLLFRMLHQVRRPFSVLTLVKLNICNSNWVTKYAAQFQELLTQQKYHLLKANITGMAVKLSLLKKCPAFLWISVKTTSFYFIYFLNYWIFTYPVIFGSFFIDVNYKYTRIKK